MNPDLERLISLQQADREIFRLQEEIAALPRRVAVIEEKLAGTRARLEKAKEALAADHRSRRRLETEVQALQEKISKYREQSLAVKTNDQYKALMHEIEFAQQEIRVSEDKMLEAMVDSESQEAELKASEAEMKEETAEIEKEKAEARERTAVDEQQLAEWSAKRDLLRTGIGVDVLERYDRVLAHRKDSALAEARAHQCGACHVMLRPQTYAEIRTNQDIVLCDSCGRILYYDATQEPPPPPASRTSRRRARSAEDGDADAEGSVAEANSSHP
ncbi:MAG: C4-type zinc ribbon domain-containing protein [Acidobacteria bacterium]|nr:C4-type zinc ribbon domain-containing protein [Acidobacteriota bacterium]